MDIKKRKADLQLLPEIANNGEAEEVSQQTKKAKEDR